MQPLVVVLGPTAVGKTKISLDLAARLKGEIISGDSMQVYRYMDIGTAKIKPHEMRGIPHHLIDIKNPDESFSVAEFQQLAEEKILEIAGRQRIPILVGGTGLYIQAVIDCYNFAENEGAVNFRNTFRTIAHNKGKEYLHRLLSEIDPPSAEKIHVNDLKRTIRALEYYYATGRRISDNTQAFDRTRMKKYNAVLIGLLMERSELYARINARVDKMMADGFLEEVRNLLEMGYTTEMSAMQGLGYKQLSSYLKGEYDLNTAVELIKRDTRRFAKRQLTWFKRDPRINWFQLERFPSYESMLDEIVSIVGRTIKMM